MTIVGACEHVRARMLGFPNKQLHCDDIQLFAPQETDMQYKRDASPKVLNNPNIEFRTSLVENGFDPRDVK